MLEKIIACVAEDHTVYVVIESLEQKRRICSYTWNEHIYELNDATQYILEDEDSAGFLFLLNSPRMKELCLVTNSKLLFLDADTL